MLLDVQSHAILQFYYLMLWLVPSGLLGGLSHFFWVQKFHPFHLQSWVALHLPSFIWGRFNNSRLYHAVYSCLLQEFTPGCSDFIFIHCFTFQDQFTIITTSRDRLTFSFRDFRSSLKSGMHTKWFSYFFNSSICSFVLINLWLIFCYVVVAINKQND